MTKIIAIFTNISPNAGLPKLHGKLNVLVDDKEVISIPMTIQDDGLISLDSPSSKVSKEIDIMQKISDVGRGILLMWLTTKTRTTDMPHPIIVSATILKDGSRTFDMGINWYKYNPTPKTMEWKNVPPDSVEQVIPNTTPKKMVCEDAAWCTVTGCHHVTKHDCIKSCSSRIVCHGAIATGSVCRAV